MLGFCEGAFPGHECCSAPRIIAVEMEGAGAAAAIEQGRKPGNSHKIHDDPGDIRCGRCLHNGMDWDRLPRSPSAKSRVCDCLRNRSESSVFYSCRFSFSGLMAAKLAAFKVIWRSAQPICFLDKSHIAFSFYIRRTIVSHLSHPQRPAQLYPSLPGVEGARALAREARGPTRGAH